MTSHPTPRIFRLAVAKADRGRTMLLATLFGALVLGALAAGIALAEALIAALG